MAATGTNVIPFTVVGYGFVVKVQARPNLYVAQTMLHKPCNFCYQ